MGTRSVVAVRTVSGWKGRYVHWDGSPDTRLPILLAMVQRDGVEKVRRTIVTGKHYGWSSLDENTPETFDVCDHAALSDWVATHGRYPVTDPGRGDGRFYCVGGYGVAYAAPQQVKESEWYTSEDKYAGWLEWAFVLDDACVWYIDMENALVTPVNEWKSLPYLSDALLLATAV